MRILMLAIAVFLLAGCEGRTLHVESNTSWTGYIGGDAGSSVEGRGNHSWPLNPGTTCWSFQKETEGGTLRAYASGGGIAAPDRQGDATTTAAYGVVSGCTD